LVRMATKLATPRMMPLPLIRFGIGCMGCMFRLPECIKKGATLCDLPVCKTTTLPTTATTNAQISIV
jgi:hypothetical protein